MYFFSMRKYMTKNSFKQTNSLTLRLLRDTHREMFLYPSQAKDSGTIKRNARSKSFPFTTTSSTSNVYTNQEPRVTLQKQDKEHSTSESNTWNNTPYLTLMNTSVRVHHTYKQNLNIEFVPDTDKKNPHRADKFQS